MIFIPGRNRCQEIEHQQKKSEHITKISFCIKTRLTDTAFCDMIFMTAIQLVSGG